MKMYCITSDIDTKVGLRLTGIDGIVTKEKQESDEKIEEVLKNEDIGILIVTNKIYEMSKQKLDYVCENRKMPLLVII